MIGYRYHGHNEVDEPSFTQPKMYAKIRSMSSPPTMIREQLMEDGIIDEDDVTRIYREIDSYFEGEY